MIPDVAVVRPWTQCKPRASGDDPPLVPASTQWGQ